jgi:putative membrane protein
VALEEKGAWEIARRSRSPAIRIFTDYGFAAFWRHINGTFLVTLFAGVLFSIFSLANLVNYALAYHPLLVWGFFFGLILASILYIARQLPLADWRVWVAFVIGTLIALGISVIKPAQLPGEWWMVFIAGAIAICAMILPGVSGSFLLLLMGMYQVFLTAIATVDLFILMCFFAGCVVGLLTFSHLLSWLLHHYHAITLATLTGFLLGSLNIVWPWKQTLEVFVNRHGEAIPMVQKNILPFEYAGDPQLLLVLLLAVGGLLLVLALEHLAGAGKGRTSPHAE